MHTICTMQHSPVWFAHSNVVCKFQFERFHNNELLLFWIYLLEVDKRECIFLHAIVRDKASTV